MKNKEKMSSLDLFLSRIANRKYTSHRYSTEWPIGMLIAGLVALSAISLSIFAGYFFVFDFFIGFVKVKFWAQIATFIILILIEAGAQFYLSKTFKFSLKGEVFNIKGSLFMLILFFLASATFSTNGLSMYKSETVNLKQEITEIYDLKEKNSTINYDNDIQFIQDRIEKIKPQNWDGNGNRNIYSKEQNKTIDKYTEEILSLKQKKRSAGFNLNEKKENEINLNKAQTTKKANVYFWFAFVIMIVEMITSAYFMNSWKRIHQENNTEEYIKDKYKSQYNSVENEISLVLDEVIDKKQQEYLYGLRLRSIEKVPFE
ncbi:MAG: hypothetical protein ACTSUT_10625, partial [Promethearchaeota archaeon]